MLISEILVKNRIERTGIRIFIEKNICNLHVINGNNTLIVK